jgi:hypothetical protein
MESYKLFGKGKLNIMSCINTSHFTDPEYFIQTTGEYPFRCLDCSLAFRREEDRKKHCSTTHQSTGLVIRVIIRKDQNGVLRAEVCHQIKPIGINY